MYPAKHFGSDQSIGGHNGIVDTPATWAIDYGKPFSIDSFKTAPEGSTIKGVQVAKFRVWCRPHYVLGIHRVILRIYRTPRGVKLGIELKAIEDLSAMAQRASWYIERPYANVLWSMWQAPKKFICSSLVWWCAKKVYGIDLSNRSKATVWPKDIYASPYTYVKCQVR